jgi:hypothetical protein
MPAPTDRRIHLSADLELDRVVSLKQAADLRNVSIDTIKRQGKRGEIEILQLSPRRHGVRLRVALLK